MVDKADWKPTAEKAWALAKAKRGAQAAIARECGISKQTMVQWKVVPPTRVLAVEKVTGVPRHLLRGDIYPAPEQARVLRPLASVAA